MRGKGCHKLLTLLRNNISGMDDNEFMHSNYEILGDQSLKSLSREAPISLGCMVSVEKLAHADILFIDKGGHIYIQYQLTVPPLDSEGLLA